VKARKEVILSAGTIGTTQILQLSGIGNADDLQALNISVLIDNPAVGANLIDHVILPNIFNVTGDESLDSFLRDPILLGPAIDQWTTNRTGIIANTFSNIFGFARLPNNLPIFKTVADPANGPKSPHWEIVVAVTALHLVKILLPTSLYSWIGFVSPPQPSLSCLRKFLDFSHCPS
jgi:hypothetical protein